MPDLSQARINSWGFEQRKFNPGINSVIYSGRIRIIIKLFDWQPADPDVICPHSHTKKTMQKLW